MYYNTLTIVRLKHTLLFDSCCPTLGIRTPIQGERRNIMLFTSPSLELSN